MTTQHHDPECDPERLAAHVDGELGDSEQRDLERHLADCPSCRNQLALQGTLKHALARLEGRSAPPASVRARIEALSLRHRSRGARRRLWWLVGAATAVLVAAGTWTGLSARPSSLAQALIADHLKSVPPERPPEVASGEPETVRRFFEGRVPFRPVTPELPGSRLVGGRLCVIRGHTMQLLFYEHRQRMLSLFVSKEPRRPAGGCETSLGHGVCRRRGGNVTLMLVGELPKDRLDELLHQARL